MEHGILDADGARGVFDVLCLNAGRDLQRAEVLTGAENAVVLPSTAAETLLARYGLYLERERGLASQSAVDYVRAARVFFVWYSPTAGFDPRGRSSTVIEYVLFVCQPDRPEDPRRTTSRLRSLLRFLFVEDLTDTALAATVPSAASRSDSLPKGVSSSDVARLFATCDRRTAVGRRDFAILTVLVRLGLRASEVASIRLSDIDWHLGELAAPHHCPVEVLGRRGADRAQLDALRLVAVSGRPPPGSKLKVKMPLLPRRVTRGRSREGLSVKVMSAPPWAGTRAQRRRPAAPQPPAAPCPSAPPAWHRRLAARRSRRSRSPTGSRGRP